MRSEGGMSPQMREVFKNKGTGEKFDNLAGSADALTELNKQKTNYEEIIRLNGENSSIARQYKDLLVVVNGEIAELEERMKKLQ